jgi:hypothetical protein
MSDSELLKLGRERRDFGLDPTRLTVELLGEKVASRVSFGGRTPAGDGVYAALDGRASVYIVSTNVLGALDLPADGFRSRRLFPQDDPVDAFDIRCGNKAFMRFVREAAGWRMAEPKQAAVSAERVEAFLDGLSAARAQTFVWPVGASNETTVAALSLLACFGLDPENAVSVALRASGGRDRIVSFGKSASAGRVYALAQNGGAIVTVDAALRARVEAESAAFIDARLFPCAAEQVATVLLADGDRRVLLAKDAAGAWRLDEPVAAPADAQAVDALLSRLLRLRTDDLDPACVRVSLATNVPPVAVARQSVFASVNLANLRSREVLRIDPLDVRRLVVTPANTSAVSVVRAADRTVWTVENAQRSGGVDAAAVDRLLRALSPLKAVRVERLSARAGDLGAYGLEIPFCALAVDRRREDAVRRNILIGDKTDGGRFATLGASDAIFVLSDEIVDRLTSKLVRDE